MLQCYNDFWDFKKNSFWSRILTAHSEKFGYIIHDHVRSYTWVSWKDVHVQDQYTYLFKILLAVAKKTKNGWTETPRCWQ